MFTTRPLSYFWILRPANAAMSMSGVALGFWIGNARGGIAAIALLCAAAFAATGFGNVINDIFDIATDRMSHPDRPLPSGAMTLTEAWLCATALLAASLLCSFAVSPAHGIGAGAAMALLAVYARRLKRTPLMGNALVSLLVAYPVIYGALGAPDARRLYAPAALAFLVNLCREIVKDIQDSEGDAAAGMTTSAVLPRRAIRALLVASTIAYIPALFAPYALGHFRSAYLAVCIVAVIPLRALWLRRFLASSDGRRLGAISLLIKAEMLAGLAALAIDQALTLARSS